MPIDVWRRVGVREENEKYSFIYCCSSAVRALITRFIHKREGKLKGMILFVKMKCVCKTKVARKQIYIYMRKRKIDIPFG